MGCCWVALRMYRGFRLVTRRLLRFWLIVHPSRTIIWLLLNFFPFAKTMTHFLLQIFLARHPDAPIRIHERVGEFSRERQIILKIGSESRAQELNFSSKDIKQPRTNKLVRRNKEFKQRLLASEIQKQDKNYEICRPIGEADEHK